MPDWGSTHFAKPVSSHPLSFEVHHVSDPTWPFTAACFSLCSLPPPFHLLLVAVGRWLLLLDPGARIAPPQGGHHDLAGPPCMPSAPVSGHLRDFSSFSLALVTVLRMTLGLDIFEDLVFIDRFMTYIWYAVYTILTWFFMLNLVIGLDCVEGWGGWVGRVGARSADVLGISSIEAPSLRCLCSTAESLPKQVDPSTMSVQCALWAWSISDLVLGNRPLLPPRSSRVHSDNRQRFVARQTTFRRRERGHGAGCRQWLNRSSSQGGQTYVAKFGTTKVCQIMPWYLRSKVIELGFITCSLGLHISIVPNSFEDSTATIQAAMQQPPRNTTNQSP